MWRRRPTGVPHHGRAAEENVVADSGEEFHALLKTILQSEDRGIVSRAADATMSLKVRSDGGGGGGRPYHRGLLHQSHVVSTERHHKQHRPDVLEAADPLPPLSPLAAHIVHPSHTEIEKERKTLQDYKRGKYKCDVKRSAHTSTTPDSVQVGMTMKRSGHEATVWSSFQW